MMESKSIRERPQFGPRLLLGDADNRQIDQSIMTEITKSEGASVIDTKAVIVKLEIEFIIFIA